MPSREKYGAGEKVEIVGRYLRGEISISEASRMAGADRETVRQWIIRYESEGAAGFLPNKRNRKYSWEEKLYAVEEYLSGKGSQVEISRKYGLRSKTQLQNWVKVLYNALSAGIPVTEDMGSAMDYMESCPQPGPGDPDGGRHVRGL